MENMQAAVFLGEKLLELQTRKIPEIKDGSILIRVESCAICGSDLRIFKHGNERVIPPRIIGHEVAGEIIEIGSGVSSQYKIGDRVSVGADVPCGNCTFCLSGRANCCDVNLAIGYQFEGGFSQYMLLDPLVVSGGPLQKFETNIDFDTAALSEPLACCLNGYEVGLIKPNSTVVVFGAGPIGIMLVTLGLSYFEAARIIVIDPNKERLELAKTFGANHTLNPNETDVIASVLELTNGMGANMIFTACPDVGTHEQAIAMVAKRGVINLFGGLPKSCRPIQFYSNQLHYREAYLTGSHGSTPKQHQLAVKLITDKKINISSLISHRFKLDQINEAFAQAASGQSMKVIIKPNA